MSYFTKTARPEDLTGWRSPVVLLMIMAGAMQLSFAAWWNLMNNFAVQELDFTGREIGIQQSIREIPGFLSFLAVYFLLVMREQTLAYVSLLLLGLGVAFTGYFPTAIGFYITTLIMSIGFHYYETMAQSLSLQWFAQGDRGRQPGQNHFRRCLCPTHRLRPDFCRLEDIRSLFHHGVCHRRRPDTCGAGLRPFRLPAFP